MDQQSQLIEIAEDIALSRQYRAADIERELAKIEAQKAKLQAEFHTANLAHERLSRFVPILGGDLQCPRCWINHETRAALRAIGGGAKQIDNFRCNTCNETFALTF